jgi:hypothetical protein
MICLVILLSYCNMVVKKLDMQLVVATICMVKQVVMHASYKTAETLTTTSANYINALCVT